LWFQASPGKWFGRPYLKKIPNTKKTGGVAQVVKHLPNKGLWPCPGEGDDGHIGWEKHRNLRDNGE
jgi:hypothetical protein